MSREAPMFMILRRWKLTILLALITAAALLLPKCEGPGPHPFTRAPVFTTAARQAEAQCTHAYGQCEAVEYIHVRANGTEWIETCFTVAASAEGHGGVLVAVAYCYRP